MNIHDFPHELPPSKPRRQSVRPAQLRGSLVDRRRAWRESQRSASVAYMRWRRTEPGMMRLMLPVLPGEDPLVEWKLWGARVSRLLGRLPGNWRTSRGIRKRKRALMSLLGG